MQAQVTKGKYALLNVSQLTAWAAFVINSGGTKGYYLTGNYRYIAADQTRKNNDLPNRPVP